jgi:hypothetical protein
MKNVILGLMAATMLVMGSTQVQAADYNYVGLSYDTTATPINVGDGMSVAGSYQFSDHFYGVLGYKADGFNNDVSASVATIGLGVKTPLTDKLDLFGVWSGAVITENAFEFSEYNYTLQGGLRYQAYDNVELRTSVGVSNLGNSVNDNWYGSVGAEYALTDTGNWRVGVDLVASPELNQVHTSLRWYY